MKMINLGENDIIVNFQCEVKFLLKLISLWRPLLDYLLKLAGILLEIKSMANGLVLVYV